MKCHTGLLAKTASASCVQSTSGTTHAITTQTGAAQQSLSARENRLFSPPRRGRSYLRGGNSGMTQGKSASTAVSSEMSPARSPLTLSERLTPSLISAGLVRGTTRTFGRRLLRLGIRDFVSFAPDGSVVAIQNQDSLFLSDSHHNCTHPEKGSR